MDNFLENFNMDDYSYLVRIISTIPNMLIFATEKYGWDLDGDSTAFFWVKIFFVSFIIIMHGVLFFFGRLPIRALRCLAVYQIILGLTTILWSHSSFKDCWFDLCSPSVNATLTIPQCLQIISVPDYVHLVFYIMLIFIGYWFVLENTDYLADYYAIRQ